MDRDDVEEIVRGMLADRNNCEVPDTNKPEMLIPIKPFKAVNGEDAPIEVIGVGYFQDILQFLCIAEEDGEVWPTMVEQVFRRPEGKLVGLAA